MKSIIQNEKKCYLSGSTTGLEEHHIIFGVGLRKLSEKYGLKVWLCYLHHRDNRIGVHGLNKEADMMLKQLAQRTFEKKYSHEKWMEVFGKNYL